jgi:protein-S-isoprenylcysteine O-methyltransferase Ste14
MNRIVIPPTIVVLSLIIIGGVYFIIPKYNWIPFPLNLAGLIIAFGGFAIMGKARDLFKKHNTNLDIKESSALVTEGVYSKTRNPMYLGMFTLLLGIGICFGNLLSMITPFGFIFAIHFIFIPKEEKMMQDTFGEQYSEYKKQVKRWL